MGDFKGVWTDKSITDLGLPPAKMMVLSMIKEMQPFHASNGYIAEILNMERRTVSRIISSFQTEKLITITGSTSARIITIDKIAIDSYRQNVLSTIDKMSYTLDKMSQTKDKMSNNIKDSKDNKVYIKEKPKKPSGLKHKYGEFKHILLTDTEYSKLDEKLDNKNYWIKTMDEGIELKGYKYKSHYLAILKWYRDKDKFKHFSSTANDYNQDAVIRRA